MSLLLDALHRASKDKERASSAAVVPAPTVAQPSPAETRQLTADFPNLTTPEPSSSMSRPVAEANKAASPVALTLELEPVLKATFEPELTLAPAPVPVSSPAPAPDPSPKPAVQAETAKFLVGKYAAPTTSASAVTPEITPPVKPAAVSPPEVASVVKKLEPAPALPERAAQDIRRAYASASPSKSGGRRRLIILGSVAGVLALAIGSVFSGLWGDPEKVLGLSGQSSVAITALPQPSSTAAPQPEEAASQASAVPGPVVVEMPAAPLAESSANSMPVKVVISEKMLTTVNSAKPMATPKLVAAPVAVQSVLQPSISADALRPGVPKAPVPARPNVAQGLELGYTALLEGRLNEAAQAYRQALAVNPDEIDALLGMAYIHRRMGQHEQAQEDYRRVLRQDPANVTAQSGLLALDSVSDTTLMAGRARELAARQPGSADAMATAGSALVRDGMLADAAMAFAKAQAIEPGNPLHAYNHAVALDRLGQFAAALDQYERVIFLLGGSTATVRAFQIETVRQRAAQLRQAIGNPGEKDK